MGFFGNLFGVNNINTLSDVRNVESPWANADHLEGFTIADLYPEAELPLTRTALVRVPAYSRGRDLICTTVARLSLLSVDADGNVKTNADGSATNSTKFVSQPELALPRYQTVLWTLDDLLFSGISWWYVTKRFALDKRPQNVVRLGPGRVTVDYVTGICKVDGNEVDPADLIRFDGPNEGLLARAGKSARDAIALEDAAAKFAANPVPVMELHGTDNNNLTPEQAKELTNTWAKARQDSNGLIAYTPSNVELRVHGTPTEALLIAGRNQAAIDAARFMGVPADVIDASPDKTSFTYANVAQKSQALVDFGLAPYAHAIESRLSMADITPEGTLIRFAFGELTEPSDDNPTTPQPQDEKQAA